MSFSERLKSERKRLRLTQPQLAELAGTTKQSQLKYEKGMQKPGTEYLIAVAAVGVDVQYLLTGVRSEMALTHQERTLLQLYRKAAPAIQGAALAVLASGGVQGQNVTVNGNVSGGSVVAHTVNNG